MNKSKVKNRKHSTNYKSGKQSKLTASKTLRNICKKLKIPYKINKE